MLSQAIKLKTRLARRFGRRRPFIVALFSFRYDAHLVGDLLENLDPIVDGWVAFDDRGSSEMFSGEPARRRRLIARARQIGADWGLAIDPDERLERAAAGRIRTMIATREPVFWGFHIRELFLSDAYRVDGAWGKKYQCRLFPLRASQETTDAALHGSWVRRPAGCEIADSGLNLYHLKMISRARRVARRRLYEHLDPTNAFQKRGYAYLAEDEGAVLETIPPERSYRPRHIDDEGLWMPTP